MTEFQKSHDLYVDASTKRYNAMYMGIRDYSFNDVFNHVIRRNVANNNPKFPNDLETQYVVVFSKFIENVNRTYEMEIRKLLNTPGFKDRLNAFDIRMNVFNFPKFRKELLRIKDRLLDSKGFEKIFKSMTNVFKRIDNKIVKGIAKSFKKSTFKIPKIELSAPSTQLTEAIERNVSFIEGITSKQIDNLQGAVLSSVQGGGSFDTIVKEVQTFSTQGKNYAEFVARDQVAKTYSEINQERQKSVGFDRYKWFATAGDWDNVRPTHKEMHNRSKKGETFSWDSPPLVGDRDLHPGEDYQCRCIAVPAF